MKQPVTRVKQYILENEDRKKNNCMDASRRW